VLALMTRPWVASTRLAGGRTKTTSIESRCAPPYDAAGGKFASALRLSRCLSVDDRFEGIALPHAARLKPCAALAQCDSRSVGRADSPDRVSAIAPPDRGHRGSSWRSLMKRTTAAARARLARPEPDRRARAHLEIGLRNLSRCRIGRSTSTSRALLVASREATQAASEASCRARHASEMSNAPGVTLLAITTMIDAGARRFLLDHRGR